MGIKKGCLAKRLMHNEAASNLCFCDSANGK